MNIAGSHEMHHAVPVQGAMNKNTHDHYVSLPMATMICLEKEVAHRPRVVLSHGVCYLLSMKSISMTKPLFLFTPLRRRHFQSGNFHSQWIPLFSAITVYGILNVWSTITVVPELVHDVYDPGFDSFILFVTPLTTTFSHLFDLIPRILVLLYR